MINVYYAGKAKKSIYYAGNAEKSKEVLWPKN